MKKTFMRILLPILVALTLLLSVTVVAIAASDENGEQRTDAMVDILADEELAGKLVAEETEDGISRVKYQ